MRRRLAACAALLAAAWAEYTGEAAFQRHLAHLREHHPGRPLPDRRTFWLAEVERRWSGVNRCC